MGRYLLGIDAGLTVTKAVIFDLDGVHVGSSSRRVPSASPQPHFVERDQDALWQAVVESVREVVASTRVSVAEIEAIGVTAHGDGLYLVDEECRPVYPGIMSLDTRAQSIVDRWKADGTSERALEASGQIPFASTPAALLAWFADNAADVLDSASYALPCKDMLKGRLTGEISTDHTEASLSFVDYRTQRYSQTILDLFGIPQLWRLLPPAIESTAVSGRLSSSAAAELGLREGTPIAAGAHDVDCSAIGSGALDAGQFALIAGTYSINQAISSEPSIDRAWCTRNFVTPGLWMNQAVSPSSATNMEWFVKHFCAADLRAAAETGDPFAFVEQDIAAIADDPDDVVYLPFLYGSPLPVDASGTMIGLRGWHSRGHVLRAIMQGVVLNHQWHFDELERAFQPTSIHLTGGATNSQRWCQMFADALERDIHVADSTEAGAFGVCLLAGVASGAYASLADAVSRAVQPSTIYRPQPDGVARMRALSKRYRYFVAAMEPIWRYDMNK